MNACRFISTPIAMRWPRAFGVIRFSISLKELLEIAWEGLRRQNQVNDLGDDETIYLKPLKELLSQGKCPADVLLEKWEGELHHDIKRLIAYSAYKLP